MQDGEKMLSVEEAEERAQRGADELEELLNQLNRTTGEWNEERHKDLVSHFMSLLAETYGIEPDPSNDTTGTPRDWTSRKETEYMH